MDRAIYKEKNEIMQDAEDQLNQWTVSFEKKNVLLNDKEKTSEVLDRKTRTAMYACVLNIIEGDCLPSFILPE